MARPIFVGNFEQETRQSELERLFRKYGRVERVDMKSGKLYCFFITLFGDEMRNDL
jgi:arginine/serine-rich splicing factor 4/5/6